ncbi:putative protein kinase RLK-Pelle-LRR-III family [Helianthus annuus]|nr:putative protein kinase RLK-Pelle-LRR-III family [Helianthus annuus]KAJ0885646.1 putative protein kinase RLK-Pelle-LRR-III family [Helianthus annuus]
MLTTGRRKPSSSPLAVFLFSLLILPLQKHECAEPPKDESLNPDERQALLDFLDKVSHNKLKLNWDESKLACTWKGVTCAPPDNKTVMYLQLPAKSFVGPIPYNTIGRLTGLRSLSLRVNKFSGELPPDFANLTFLTRLSLNNNSFSGTIPEYFSYFRNLVRLTLNNNSFSGGIPYIHSEKLDKFDVSLNKLIGAIPASLANFSIANFTENVYLCGAPTNITCNGSYPAPDDPLKQKEKDKKTPEILGISIGSGVVLLIILCCVRRKMCTQMPKPPLEALADAKVERKKLVLFDHHGVHSFDLEDLLNVSAEVLGEGSVGRSYKQVLEGKNVTVVVKRLKRVVVTENEFRTRMEVLGKMKNKNVVPLIGYYYSQDEKWVVYGYIDGGSLYDRLHGSIASGQTTQFDWDHRMRVALSAARGLAYLHEDKKGEDGEISVVHGNINSSNILIRQEPNSEAFVSDYGLNTLFDASSSQDHHVNGYWAPEVRDTREVTLKSDVYSFGVLLLELLTGKTPKQASLGSEGVHFSKLLESGALEEQKDDTFDVELRMVPNNVKEMMKEFLEIAKDCVSEVPEQRPIMQDVVSKIEKMWLRQSSDDHSKVYDYMPSTETQDTPSTITLDTPSTITLDTPSTITP